MTSTPTTIVRTNHTTVRSIPDLIDVLQVARIHRAAYTINVGRADDGDAIIVVHIAAADGEADLHASVVTNDETEVVNVTRAANVRPCGRCPLPNPAAVDWGCACGSTTEERNADAVAFARIHD